MKLLFIFLFSVLLFGKDTDSLTIFKQQVIKEEKNFTNKQKALKKNKSNNSSDTNSTCLSSCGSYFFKEFTKLTFNLWYYHNSGIYYNKYPFENKKTRKYINFKERKDKLTESQSASYINLKKYYYNFIISYRYIDNKTYAVHSKISGKFNQYFGPRISFDNLISDNNYLHIFTLGGNFSLMQFDLLSLDLYLSFAGMTGIINRYGFDYGFTLYSFIVKPVSLKIDYGYQIYKIKFNNINIEIGWHLYGFEFFLGYKYFKATDADLSGPVIGVNYWL